MKRLSTQAFNTFYHRLMRLTLLVQLTQELYRQECDPVKRSALANAVNAVMLARHVHVARGAYR
jgi:hypothetical protein